MAIRIQLRRDTALNWTTVNPILAEGEVGLELDTDKFKIGNGLDPWVLLPYGGLQGPAGESLINIDGGGPDEIFSTTSVLDSGGV